MGKRSDAAGCLVWRHGKKHLEFLVIETEAGLVLPSARLEPNEGFRDAAVRSAAVLAGVGVALRRPLGSFSIKASVAPDIAERIEGGEETEAAQAASGEEEDPRKESSQKPGKPGKTSTYYWLAQEVGEDHPIIALRRDRPRYLKNSSPVQARWITAEDAQEELALKGESKLVGKALKLYKHEEFYTRAVLLVRHARARKRSVWKGPEETRPLTPQGAERATEIAYNLANYGVQELVSSPWKRCIDTLAPYAERTGLEIQMAPELTEASYKKSSKKAVRKIHKLLGTSGVPTAASLHRPTLPGVLDAVLEHSNSAVQKKIPRKDPYLKTGEILVMHLIGSTVVAAERYRPVSPD